MAYTWMNAIEGIIGSATTRGVPVAEIRAELCALVNNDLIWKLIEEGTPQVMAVAERAVKEALDPPPAEPCDHIWLPSRGIVDGVPAEQEFCTRCGARK